MTVFFDMYEIALGNGKSIGIHNYAVALLKILALKYPHIQLIVPCTGANEDEIKAINGSNITPVLITDHFPSFKERYIWLNYKAIKCAKKYSADIYYSPKGFTPGLFKRKKKPLISVTIHDMIPHFYREQYPHYFTRLENFLIPMFLKNSADKANSVITISDYSKAQIEKYTKHASNIHVIHNGVEIDHSERNIGENIHGEYIFSLTSHLPHKNLNGIVQSYAKYHKKTANPLPLIICGVKKELLAQYSLKAEVLECITCVKDVPDDELATLYKHAKLFLFLSQIEGFGFPPMEALSYFTPIIVSDIPIFKEILHEYAHYADIKNYDSVADKITEVLEHSNLEILDYNDLLNHYTWEECTEKVVKTWEEMLS